jgi:hypothetical protein
MAQTTTAEPIDVLPIPMTARLHLSMTEYDALGIISRVYQCSIEDVINTILHRSIHAELEIVVPKCAFLKKLAEETDSVFGSAKALEQPQDSKEIEIATIIKVKSAKYEQFRRMFDEQSWQDFVDYCINSGHIDEVLGDNPDLMAEFLKDQNERLYGKKKED